MPTNGSEPAAQPQENRTLLIGSIADTTAWLGGCPHAASLLARSLSTGHDLVCSLPCRRWGCRYCGPRRCFQLGIRVELAEPNRLITLTVNPSLYQTPREAYDRTRRQVSELTKVLRKRLGSFEYLRVLEATKRGWPHYHLVTRCPFIQQRDLSAAWNNLSGAPIVDIRAIKRTDNVCRYVMKYLAKQTHVEWTTRRVSATRGFFPKKEKGEWTQPDVINRVRNLKHPIRVLHENYQGMQITEIRPGCYRIDD